MPPRRLLLPQISIVCPSFLLYLLFLDIDSSLIVGIWLSLCSESVPSATAVSTDRDWKREQRFQSGVLRTNCIDCIDRTNVAQYAFGLVAVGRQLHAVGLSDSPEVDMNGKVAESLMFMYEKMGNVLALQYGGSPAHNTVRIYTSLSFDGYWYVCGDEKCFGFLKLFLDLFKPTYLSVVLRRIEGQLLYLEFLS